MTGAGIHGGAARGSGQPPTTRIHGGPDTTISTGDAGTLIHIHIRRRNPSSSTSTMPRRLPTIFARMTAEKLRQQAQIRAQAEADAAAEADSESSAVGYFMVSDDAEIVDITGSEFIKAEDERMRVRAEAEIGRAHV